MGAGIFTATPAFREPDSLTCQSHRCPYDKGFSQAAGSAARGRGPDGRGRMGGASCREHKSTTQTQSGPWTTRGPHGRPCQSTEGQAARPARPPPPCPAPSDPAASVPTQPGFYLLLALEPEDIYS